jgi:hypothetical protein
MRSVIGMFLYLMNTSRTDCAFAMNQCAHFAHDPREPHHKALKQLVAYLIKTKHEGMTIRPTSKNTLDCYVDADFAGLYGKEDSQDPTCVRSRTGYIITLGDNPVVWSSKLQLEIAYCTQEAEHYKVLQQQ